MITLLACILLVFLLLVLISIVGRTVEHWWLFLPSCVMLIGLWLSGYLAIILGYPSICLEWCFVNLSPSGDGQMPIVIFGLGLPVLFFAILMVALFLTWVFFVETLSHWWSGVLLVLILGVAFFFGYLTPIYEWAVANPALFAASVVAYFIVGAIYAFYKFVRFSYKIREKNRFHKERFLLANNSPVMTDELFKEWTKLVQTRRYTYNVQTFHGEKEYPITKPNISDHKSEIALWVIYWVPSLFWTLLNDPLRKIANLVYDLIYNQLKAINDHIWKDEDSKFKESTK